MKLKSKKIAVFLENMYEDLEFWYPNIRMKEEGAEVVVIAPEAKEKYTGKHGLPAVSDKAINEVNTGEFDALIIPGGYSPDKMRRHKEMVDFVKKMDDEGKLIAAICHAGWMMASADIIKGRKLTSFFSIKDDLVHAGAEWIDKEVVIDGNIITSRHPEDLPAFCREIIKELSK
ncbi:MAG: type 1 glutamine amidotransferase domain-containing protein [Ignavibacteriaceae bacterium]